MSLFNQACGYSPMVRLALAMMDKEPNDFPRFRDAYINIEEDDPRLVVMTRTGGGNREGYQTENEAIRQLPGFIKDEDDDFDSTFAYWYFQPEDVALVQLNGFISSLTDEQKVLVFEKPMVRFKRMLEGMKA